MGAKTWMLVGAFGSAREALSTATSLDRDASMRLAERLFPHEHLELIDEGDLSFTCPPEDEIHIGCFPAVSVVAAKEFGVDYPSRLESRFLKGIAAPTIYLHAMHSVVDWFAFAVWKESELVRSLSLSPDSGILEDVGSRMAFEVPYWAGEHPAVDSGNEEEGEPPYPFPFHPLELGEAALKEFFGYQLEGFVDDTLLEPENVALLRLKRKGKVSRFAFWQSK